MKKGTQNIRGLGHKEDDLDTSLYEKDISVPVITEIKKKLKGTKYTKKLYCYLQWSQQKHDSSIQSNDLGT
jgi:hypothetical protein